MPAGSRSGMSGRGGTPIETGEKGTTIPSSGLWQRTSMKPHLFAAAVSLAAAGAAYAAAGTPIPAFEATALTGRKVTEAQLLGQPTVLIVTPSQAAAGQTRQWADALRRTLDPKAIRVRDVLAIDLPFFISEGDAIGRAKAKIPQRYHDQTWLLAEDQLERALGIPTASADAFVFVLDARGRILARVSGAPEEGRVAEIAAAVQTLQ